MIKKILVTLLFIAGGVSAAVPGDYGAQPTNTCSNIYSEQLPTGTFELVGGGYQLTTSGDFLVALEEQGSGTDDDNRHFLVWTPTCSLRTAVSNTDAGNDGTGDKTIALATQATEIENVFIAVWNEASGGPLTAVDSVKAGLFSSVTGAQAPGTRIRDITDIAGGAGTTEWEGADAFLLAGEPHGIIASDTHNKQIVFSFDETVSDDEALFDITFTDTRKLFSRVDLNHVFVTRGATRTDIFAYNLTTGVNDYSVSGFSHQALQAAQGPEPSQINASRMWAYDNVGDGFGVNWFELGGATTGTASSVASWNGSQILSRDWSIDGADNFLGCGTGTSGGTPYYWTGKFLVSNSTFEWVRYWEAPPTMGPTAASSFIDCELRQNGNFFVGYISDNVNFTVEHYTGGNFTNKTYRDTTALAAEPAPVTPPSILDDDGLLWGGNKSKAAEAYQVTERGLEMIYAIGIVLFFMAMGAALGGIFGAIGASIVALVINSAFGWIPPWMAFLMFFIVTAAVLWIRGFRGGQD